MTDDDRLDDALRLMLHDRAQDIRTVPADLLRPDLADERPVRPDRTEHRQHWLIAAAVAAVLVVSGGVASFALLRDDHHKSDPANPTPEPTPDPSPATTEQVSACPTALPADWLAKAGGAKAGSGVSEVALAASSAGAVLYSRDTGTGHEVKATNGDRSILTVPDSAKLAPGFAAFSGKYAVIGLVRSQRGENGVMNPLMQIDIVELASRQVVQKVQVTTEADYVDGGRSSDGMAVLDGKVYWDERPDYGSRQGVVRSYDIAAGTRGVAYSGTAVTVRGSAGGVYWATQRNGFDFAVKIAARTVPPAVLRATAPASRVTLHTDGTRWAWYDAARKRIGWFDGRQTRYVNGVSKPLTVDNSAGVPVSGPYVFVAKGAPDAGSVIDTRTGATATLPPGSDITLAGATIAAGAVLDGKTGSRLLRFDTAGLPGLRC